MTVIDTTTNTVVAIVALNGTAQRVAFECPVTVGRMHLPGGSYSMAFLPGDQNKGFLSFFSGPATRQNVKGMAAVEVTAADAPDVIIEYPNRAIPHGFL